MKQIYQNVLLVTLLGLCACASTPPPTGVLDEAQVAIQRAEAGGAIEHAPLELRFAREKLAAARLAVEVRDHQQAALLAEQSLINSELAVAKTAAAEARDAARRQEEANEELKAELADSGGER